MELGARHLMMGIKAMFAWESADTGDEVTPLELLTILRAEDVRLVPRSRNSHQR